MNTAENPNTQAPAVEYAGRIFENETALHEWRLIFDFEYFLDFSSQL